MARQKDFYSQVLRLLRSLPLDKIQHVVDRVFQRIPSLANEMIDESEEAPSNPQKKNQLISLFMAKLEELTNNPDQAKKVGLSPRVSDYLRYIDLLVTVHQSARKTWQVYFLQGFDARAIAELNVEEVGIEKRLRLKGWFKQNGMVASAQAETDDYKLWVSISFTKQTKDKTKDRTRLGKSKFFYLVHFPGEPYVYSTTPKMSSELKEAVAEAFDSTACITIPLSGKCLDSLRQLRLNREVRAAPNRPGLHVLAGERFSATRQPAPKTKEAPKLDHVTIETVHEIGDVDCLETPEAMRGRKIKMRLECGGSDVIGGLNELVSEGVLVSDPVPTWLTSLPTAGRNKLTLVSNPRKETEFELESLISRTSNKSRF